MKSQRITRFSLCLAMACGAAVAGCHSPLFRGQSPDVEQVVAEESGTPLVGELTFASGMTPVEVHGVGLVTGLNKTGSDPRADGYREQLIDEMQTHDVDNPQTILASDRTSLVLVRGFLPPGVQKGDRIDLEVTVPPRSETTSLRGGWLMQTRLREVAVVNNAVRKGDVDAIGGGDVIVDAMFEDQENKMSLLRGRVLGGGVSRVSRKLSLVLKENAASVQASAMIGKAINNRFHHYDRGIKQGVAKPLNSRVIELSVPPRYKNNTTRFMKVVRSLAIGESVADRAVRLQQLEQKLLEPTTSYGAALQLEGIGKDGVAALRKGLLSPDLEVRFYAAEALAYLDDVEAVPALAEAAAKERAFRWHAFTALATMDHVAAADALSNLLGHPSAETRYGAFRAMQARNPRDPTIRGEVLGNAFLFHEVGSADPPMIHFARTRQPEVVLFGFHQTFDPPTFLMAGRRIMVKRHSDTEVKVIRFAPGEEDQVKVVPTQVSALIRAIVEFGGGYEDVYQALRSAKEGGYLRSRLVVDARASDQRLYRRDARDSEAESDEYDDPQYRTPSPVPELFNDQLDRAQQASSSGSGGLENIPSPEAEPGFFDKIQGWWSRDK